jgi:hypothetical protein
MTRYLLLFWQLRSCSLGGALSDERTGLSFVYGAGPCQRSLSRVRVTWDSWPYFTVSDLRLPFYLQQKTPFPFIYLNNTSIVTYIFVAAVTCLPTRCLAMNVYSGSAIPAFRRIRTFRFAAGRFHSSLIERGSIAESYGGYPGWRFFLVFLSPSTHLPEYYFD